ncbi:hypothetical protein [Sinorhizobium meliloti]|uniref:hypothetical protein n=1 Tax=Rhizobium meliloti TaxID=382 RepID=UPI000FDBAF06|nr:hypothetical protein [Sinorhizobium meliloti]RVN34515.1 hypothetical protein CN118_22500 [Sinorhizobium meliloti]
MKEKNYLFERIKDAIIVGLLLIIAMVLLPPAISGGRTDSVGKFVFDYQTLITGIMAVGAAGWTISQMRRSDERQEARHRELVILGQRPEQMTFNALVDFLRSQTRLINERFSEHVAKLWLFEAQQKADGLDRWVDDQIAFHFTLAAAAARELGEVLSDARIEKMSHLFAPELYSHLKDTAKYCGALAEYTNPELKDIDYLNPSTEIVRLGDLDMTAYGLLATNRANISKLHKLLEEVQFPAFDLVR